MTIIIIRAIIFEETRGIGGIAMAKIWSSDDEKRDMIYSLLNGFMEVGPPLKAVEEKRAEIDALVDVIYRHRLRLCNRAGLDFEDRDLEGIVSAYDQLNGLVAHFMYKQGQMDAERSAQEQK